MSRDEYETARQSDSTEERNSFIMKYISENLGVPVGDKNISVIFEKVYGVFFVADSYQNFCIGVRQELRKHEGIRESLYGHGSRDLNRVLYKNKFDSLIDEISEIENKDDKSYKFSKFIYNNLDNGEKRVVKRIFKTDDRSEGKFNAVGQKLCRIHIKQMDFKNIGEMHEIESGIKELKQYGIINVVQITV